MWRQKTPDSQGSKAPHSGVFHEHSHDVQAAQAVNSALLAVFWLLVSVFILSLVASGHANNYVQTFWRPFLLLAATLVGLLSLSTLGQSLRQASGKNMLRTPWFAYLLLIPAVLVVASAPSPLGAAMLENSTNASSLSGSDGGSPSSSAIGAKFQGGLDLTPLNPNQPNPLTLEELSDRFNLGDPKELWGKPLRVIGFVSHGLPEDAYGDIGEPRKPGQPKAAYQLSRFKIFCCAADGISYSAVIVTDQDIPNDTWLQIDGQIVEDDSLNAVFIKPTRITPIPQPEKPYL
ncbi:hypothetical protein [Boudabousia marimammalium]|uniref:DUF1980 domain-containing protein n=1 Tax=Boudabousia marimammalium TaxID=156892 RepID=A0A1Q5PKF3_9ACTO|nr:hypothetical protein [Boudabousia marimammalium]OKL46705.1 hypothetical protein BM477_07060 [Boudabousia marimammalium]